MNFIDLFSGVGGFHEGFKKAEFGQCIYANEWNKYAGSVYQRHFKETEFFGGNIRTVDVDRIPKHDLLCGGFPCQAFSIAGRRKGFDDTRGTLFFEITRIIEAKRPRLILLENVKGLLSHDNGRTFATILDTISELGYWYEWEVLNSKNFGVPQNRERVFIVGHPGKQGRQKIFPLGENGEVNAGNLGNSKEACAVTSTYHKGGKGSMIELTQGNSQGYRIYSPEGISQTLTGEAGGLGAKTGLYAVLTPERKNKRQSGRRFKNEGEEMFTLTGQDVHGIAMHNTIRRLTPIECERLQGFPQFENLITIHIQDNTICIDFQKSYVNAENQNLKLQKSVGNVEKKDLDGNALFVEQNLNLKNLWIKKHVPKNVRINCVETKVEVHSQGKSFSFASYVQKQNSFLHQISTESFVQLLVGINMASEKIAQIGKVGLQQNEQYLIQAKNGKVFVTLFGKEIMQLAKNVKKDSTILNKHLKYITSSHLNLKNIDSNWIISFFYVVSAIFGYIQKETELENSLNLEIKSIFGYTAYGKNGELMSDTQRYKMMGNAVTTNVITAIAEKIKQTEQKGGGEE